MSKKSKTVPVFEGNPNVKNVGQRISEEKHSHFKEIIIAKDGQPKQIIPQVPKFNDENNCHGCIKVGRKCVCH